MNKRKFVLLFILPFYFQVSRAATGVGDLSQKVVINEDYQLEIYYDKEKGDNVTFSVIAKTKGFVGFGISPNGDMKGADIVIGGVKDDHSYFGDYHGVSNGMPVLDTKQDYHLLEAVENETHTVLTFTRVVNTCDDQDVAFEPVTQKVIWSMGGTDDIAYHEDNRGAKSVNILDPVVDEVDVSKFNFWDMRYTIAIPPKDTIYWCKFFKTENFSESRHTVAFDVILEDSISTLHTHHIDVYECDAPDGQTPDQTFGPWISHNGTECYIHDPSIPTFPAKYCTRIQYGWAVGGRVTIFPKEIGFPLLPNHYHMLEIHYDNPKSLGNLTVDTGIRVYHTNELRPNVAGYLSVGSFISYTQLIPPEVHNFVHAAHCTKECTSHFPSDGLNVFAFFLHSHMAGRAMKLRVFRGEEELPWLAYDSNYDFNFQQNRILQNEFKLQQGDHITAECVYDTRGRSGEVVLGGRSTRDEMCQIYLFYYPKATELIDCRSQLPATQLLKFLGLEEVKLSEGETDPVILKPGQFEGLRLSQMAAYNFSWTPQAKRDFQEMQASSLHSVECSPVDSHLFTGTYPQIGQEYKPKDDYCQRHDQGNGNNSGSIKIHSSKVFNCLSLLTVFLVIH